MIVKMLEVEDNSLNLDISREKGRGERFNFLWLCIVTDEL